MTFGNEENFYFLSRITVKFTGPITSETEDGIDGIYVL